MTETIKLKSPIDGSVYAERPVATDQAVNAAVERAKAAQAEWAQTSIAERGKYLLAFLEALLAMNDEIVPELAWQMGRPTRYGGEKGGVEERTRYMVALAEKALAPYVPEDRHAHGIFLALPSSQTVTASLLALGRSRFMQHDRETELTQENMCDLVGEVANTISGNARRDFGKDFMISVPTVVAGEPEKIVTPDNIRSFVIPINWRSHSAQLVVCLE